jgi:hypothetical protein
MYVSGSSTLLPLSLFLWPSDDLCANVCHGGTPYLLREFFWYRWGSVYIRPVFPLYFDITETADFFVFRRRPNLRFSYRVVYGDLDRSLRYFFSPI